MFSDPNWVMINAENNPDARIIGINLSKLLYQYAEFRIPTPSWLTLNILIPSSDGAIKAARIYDIANDRNIAPPLSSKLHMSILIIAYSNPEQETSRRKWGSVDGLENDLNIPGGFSPICSLPWPIDPAEPTIG